jgi:multiple sugar transport system permease protein
MKLDTESVTRFLWYPLVLFGTVVLLFPIYWMLLAAIQSPPVYFEGAVPLLPQEVTTSNFERLLAETQAVTYLKNSLIITVGTTFLSTVIAVTAGYGFSRFAFKGDSLLAKGVLFTYMVSPIVIAIPLYVVFYRIGLLNSYLGVILAQTTLASPFSVWLMIQYFNTIPESYEEFGWVSGASRIRTLKDLLLPIARPGYVSAAIFAFSYAWNDFTFARIVISDDAYFPLTVGAVQMLDRAAYGWNMSMTISVFMVVPAFLVALFFQEYIIQGFNIGGMD